MSRTNGWSWMALVVTGLVLVGPSRAQQAEFHWQQPHARVLPQGDLEWTPQPFEFAAGRTVRYIDYAGGDDANPGTREQPWKHHPWDPAATGIAAGHEGPTTYVFRGGVTYRGVLRPDESGQPGEPIRLTRDPSWGEGEARIYGSEPIPGSWTQGADHERIPEPERVWAIDLDFAPRTLWMVDGDTVTRIALARDPNWTESDPQDPMSEWYTWKNPRWWTGEHKAEIDGKTYHLGIDPEQLTGQAEDYVGGTVWTEWGIVMGSPYPTQILQYDPQQQAIAFGGPWVYTASEKIIAGNRYHLEDLPQWLDEPGEFWFDKRGEGGRLYVRLPGDVDPNTVTLEAGRHVNLIDATELSHFEISGLTFRFTNVHWDYNHPQWAHPDLKAGVFRLQGSGDGLAFRNNTFEHVHMPVRIEVSAGGRVGMVVITDNVMRDTDHGGIWVKNVKAQPEDGRNIAEEVVVLRNRLERIGWRNLAGAHGHAIGVDALVVHVAGNFLDRIAGWGISVSGGHVEGDGTDVPLGRYVIHHNRVEDCLLKSCDWGAFYITSHSGPVYVFNNVAINPVGQMNWRGRRLGYAYYMDGGYKGYLFNNIAAGIENEHGHRLANHAAFQDMISFQNTVFNNTVWQFEQATRRQAPQGGRNKYLGNIFDDISEWVFWHQKPAGSPDEANQAHVPETDALFPYETNAYSSNVLHDIEGQVGVFESHGMPYAEMEGFVEAMRQRRAMKADVGIVAEGPVLVDPEAGDFRPVEGSAAIDRGVKFFVPWGLSGMVGEWNFTRNQLDPTVILDEHWYQTPYATDRAMYRTLPRYPLTGVNVTADDYVQGPLEDWTDGALELNGQDQYAVLTHEVIAAPFDYRVEKKDEEQRTVAGRDKKTVDIGADNFLIEIFFRSRPGQTDGVLVGKMGEGAGYELRLNDVGGVILELQAGGRQAELATREPVNDGQWHHVIAEVDRRANRGRVYIDGQPAAEVRLGLDEDTPLWNDADFIVGRGFAGAIDFLRVARGTLADARTTIGELYAWQFDGPHLRDFAGQPPVGRRDAGAIEHQPQP